MHLSFKVKVKFISDPTQLEQYNQEVNYIVSCLGLVIGIFIESIREEVGIGNIRTLDIRTIAQQKSA